MKNLVYPTSNVVMLALAKQKNISIKDLLLDFVNLNELKDNTKINEIITCNSVSDYIVHNSATKVFKQNGNTYNIIRLKIVANDFHFLLSITGYDNKLKMLGEPVRIIEKDCSKEWLKLLSEFNKEALLTEYTIRKNFLAKNRIENFSNLLNSFEKTTNNTFVK